MCSNLTHLKMQMFYCCKYGIKLFKVVLALSAAVFFLIRVNQTRVRGETLHPIRIQVQLPHQVGTFPSIPKNLSNESLICHLEVFLLYMAAEN